MRRPGSPGPGRRAGAFTLRSMAVGAGLTVAALRAAPSSPVSAQMATALRLVDREGDTFHFENLNEGQNPARATMTRTAEGFVSRSELARPDGTMDEIRVEYRRTEAAGGS